MITPADEPELLKRHFMKLYYEAIQRFLDEPEMTLQIRHVYDCMLLKMNWDNECFCSHGEIAKILKISRPNVTRAIKILREKGFIFEEKGPGATKTYRINDFYVSKKSEKPRHLSAVK